MTSPAINKAELARWLGVSRAYVTMLAHGKRKPSQEIVNKLKALSPVQSVNWELPISNPKSCSSASSDTSPYDAEVIIPLLSILSFLNTLCETGLFPLFT